MRVRTLERCLSHQTLGRNVRYNVIAKQIKYHWKPKGTITMLDVRNYFYIVCLSNKTDYETALFGRPWLISDHYLTVKRWNPNFDAEISTITKLPVWIRISKIPMHCFDKEFLANVGSRFGRILRVDETT